MNRLGNIETVVLDFDGVLAIMPPDFWTPLKLKALAKIVGKEVTTEDEIFKEYTKLGENPEIGWRNAYLQVGGKHEDFSEIINNASKAEYLEFDPELLRIIEALNEVFGKIVVFSGSNYGPVVDGLQVLLRDSGALKFFRRIITSDVLEGKVGKPDPQAYKQMLEMLELEKLRDKAQKGDKVQKKDVKKINPKTAVLVDDSISEIVTARGMGMRTILVGNHPDTAVEYAQPDAQIENIYGLLAILTEE
ncbi:MAG: HAD family hydrolase [Candidatus Paceibacterota bacterium]